jgi:hypothetical protein
MPVTALGGDQLEGGASAALAAAGFASVEAWTDEERDLRGVAATLARP